MTFVQVTNNRATLYFDDIYRLTNGEFEAVCNSIPATVTELHLDQKRPKNERPQHDYSCLSRLKLTSLIIVEPELTDEELVRIVRPIGHELEKLDITSCTRVAHIADCNLINLREFTCGQTSFGDEGLKELSEMCSDTLESLNAWSCLITSFRQCRPFSKLQTLSLRMCPNFGQEGVESLNALQALQKVDLAYSAVNPEPEEEETITPLPKPKSCRERCVML
ncbi:MAG: hypothetical protein JSR37_04595 [Verrucomicrobia bacterium]|nr:hypothetical protein [Verrucomicrobiota bacterium]MBS0637770.1 hypothetical protein [Verrucomicrobiota bacterium]